MKLKYTVLHNPEDALSREFVNNLSPDHDYCIITWYGSDPRETMRLVYHYLTDFTECLPQVEYADTDQFPNGLSSWERQCECHKDEPYDGPCPRAFPSVSAILPDGRLGLWDCPGSLDDCTPGSVQSIIMPDDCVGGQWLDGAIQTSESPWYSNNIIKRAVKAFVAQAALTMINKRIKQAINCIKIRTNNLERISLLQALLKEQSETIKESVLCTCIEEMAELEILRSGHVIKINEYQLVEKSPQRSESSVHLNCSV